MLMKKRGLSDVVAVTLIILLAIAAVVIVWAFVRSMLTTTGGQIEASCLDVDVKPISCDVSDNKVIVQSGPGDINLSSVRVIMYDSTGVSDVSTSMSGCTNIAPLQSASCTTIAPAITAGDSVAIAGVIKDKTGKEQVCNPSVERVPCSP